MNTKLFAAGALLCMAAGKTLHAADTDVAVTVTLTIAADIQIVWCDNLGANQDDANQTWSLGAVSLSTTYDTDTGDGTNATGGGGASAPAVNYLRNIGNTTVDVDISCDDTGTSWSSAAAAGANAFLMESDPGSASYTALNVTHSDAIDALPNDGATFAGPIYLRLSTPSSITVGGGVSQTITVTYTASLDN